MTSSYEVALVVGSYYSPRTLLRKDGLALLLLYQPVTRKTYSIWIRLEHLTHLQDIRIWIGNDTTQITLTKENTRNKPVYQSLRELVQSFLLVYQSRKYILPIKGGQDNDSFFVQLRHDASGKSRSSMVADGEPRNGQARCIQLPLGHDLFFCSRDMDETFEADVIAWFQRHGTVATVTESFDTFLYQMAQRVGNHLHKDLAFFKQCTHRFCQYTLFERFLDFCIRDADDLNHDALYKLVLQEEVLDEYTARHVLRFPPVLYFVDMRDIPMPLHLYRLTDPHRTFEDPYGLVSNEQWVLELFKQGFVSLYVRTELVDLCQLFFSNCRTREEPDGVRAVITLACKQFIKAGI